MEIPKQLRSLKFCRVQRGTKAPFEKDWNNKPYSYEEISEFGNENYGVQCGYENLAVIDCDEELLSLAVSQVFPETFSVKTGSGGMHFYYFIPELKKKIILNSKEKHLGEIQSYGTQVVGAGSLHPNGNLYEVVQNVGIKTISVEELKANLGEFMKKETEEVYYNISETPSINSFMDYCLTHPIPKGERHSVISRNMAIYLSDNPNRDILKEQYIKIQGGTPGELDNYLEKIDENGKENYPFSIGELVNFTKKYKIPFDWKQVPEYKNYIAEKKASNNLLKEKEKEEQAEDLGKKIVSFYSKRNLAEQFVKICPIYYDTKNLWWVWNIERFQYEITNEVDILNYTSKYSLADTINAKERQEILTALKQVSRMNPPEESEKSWIQFKDKIFDFKTGDLFMATPKYFITNPIPWEIGESKDTPEIDKLFEQWVGKEYVQTLKEIIAYTCSSDQFMQRLIALVGGGANGKGTFIKLLMRFLGPNNVASSELKEIANNQFETASIYKKLLCMMGEVSYDDLKNTNQIKKLAGEDQIRFCFKGKTPFSEDSITTLISATNSLPKTPDKTIGFYRKWLIIDFPNQFPIRTGIVENIPDIEFNNLANQVLDILKNLYKTQSFCNEGNFEERARKYEERSNPVLKFIDDNCEETTGTNIELRIFSNEFNKFAKENHLRIMSVRQISKVLREEGFEMGNRTIELGIGEFIKKYVILNLMLDENLKPLKPLESQVDITRKDSMSKHAGSGGSTSSK